MNIQKETTKPILRICTIISHLCVVNIRKSYAFINFSVALSILSKENILSTSSFSAVISLLQRCSQDPKIVLCLWSICQDEKEIEFKVNYCTEKGIKIDYVGTSPFKMGIGSKQFFNVLLDDRAGLESAYYNLKYVLDNVKSQSN